MKKIVFAVLILMSVVSFSQAQGEGAAVKSKDSLAEKISAMIVNMDALLKDVTPKKVQDTGDAMEKLAQDMKDILKNTEKGSAKEKEMKGMFEDTKDMVKKLKSGSATPKDIEVIKEKLTKMQKPDQK